MCLYYDAEVDKKFKQRNRNKKFVWAIKTYQIIHYNTELIPLYYGQRITKCGWVISDRRYKKLNKTELKRNRVLKGIHVYTRKHHYSFHSDVKVKCYLKDLVAVSKDRNEAVFMKIYIPKSEWNRIFYDKTKNKGNIWP